MDEYMDVNIWMDNCIDRYRWIDEKIDGWMDEY